MQREIDSVESSAYAKIELFLRFPRCFLYRTRESNRCRFQKCLTLFCRLNSWVCCTMRVYRALEWQRTRIFVFKCWHVVVFLYFTLLILFFFPFSSPRQLQQRANLDDNMMCLEKLFHSSHWRRRLRRVTSKHVRFAFFVSGRSHLRLFSKEISFSHFSLLLFCLGRWSCSQALFHRQWHQDILENQ